MSQNTCFALAEAPEDNCCKENMTLTYYYYYNHFTALCILSGTTQVSRYQRGKTKTDLNFLEQGTVSGSGISWAICKLQHTPKR